MYKEIFENLKSEVYFGKQPIKVEEKISGDAVKGPLTFEVSLVSEGSQIWAKHTFTNMTLAPKDGKFTDHLRELLYARLFISLIHVALFKNEEEV